MKSNDRLKSKKPTLEERKEVHKNLKNLYKGKSINILKLKNGTYIRLKTLGCKYKLKTLDKNKSLFYIKGNDNFFKDGAKIKIVGTVVENVLRTFHISENGSLEILYNDKIVRTNMIINISI